MVWDMKCRYHTVGGYNIKIILLDFYGIIWEITGIYEMMWEISDICRDISCCMQGYKKYTIYRRSYYI